MKILIVDDEEDVRQSIRLLIPWHEYPVTDIFEAADGEEAERIVEREKPEIIFTDLLMPRKSGLQLLEWLESHAPDSKTIVISGHDDFQYVRHTLKYGGSDYLLKPIDRGEIVTAFESAIEAWQREEAERRQTVQQLIEMNRIKPIYWDKQFSSLVSSPSRKSPSFDELHKQFGLGARSRARVAVLNADALPELLIEKFGSNMDLLFFILTNVCNELFGVPPSGYAFRHLGKDNEIVLIAWDGTDRFEALASRMHEALRNVLQASFRIGVSLEAAFPEGIADAYKEAKKALRHSDFLSARFPVRVYGEQDEAAQPALFFADYSTAISLAIKSNEPERIEAAVRAWVDAVRQLGAITLEQLDQWRSEYHLMKTYLLKETFPDEEDLEFSSSRNGFFPLQNDGVLALDVWERDLVASCVAFASVLHRKQRNEQSIIADIKKYIDSRYDQDLSLQSLSEQFFISREYVSRKFKQEYGLNVSDYVESVRIEHAQTLLANEGLSVAEVAEMVGYQDARYFSKVFGKAVGLSPMQYRKRLSATS
ncbi:response regulator [Paenibacillus sp.]|uniref:response regulator n=1 Tax=Paenibacillus sp. TaxID=58172 RepID=UPI002D5F4BF5|nr:response regulator [Paenibacillus sp.]HZG86588.1 response regulator [Paenibacillus sp.]